LRKGGRKNLKKREQGLFDLMNQAGKELWFGKRRREKEWVSNIPKKGKRLRAKNERKKKTLLSETASAIRKPLLIILSQSLRTINGRGRCIKKSRGQGNLFVRKTERNLGAWLHKFLRGLVI